MSSMYLLQDLGGVWKVDSASCSRSSMTKFTTTTATVDPVDLLVYFALKGQVGGLQANLEEGANVIHRETGPVWRRWVIYQPVTGVTWTTREVAHTGEKRHYIKDAKTS